LTDTDKQAATPFHSILNPEIQHSQMAAVCADHSEQRNRRETASRKDATLLAQLRSSHCIRLQAHKHLMDNTVDRDCPRCGQAPQTLEHWLDCPGTLQTRLEIFTTTEALTLSTLSTVPGNSVVCDDLVLTPSSTAAAAAAYECGQWHTVSVRSS